LKGDEEKDEAEDEEVYAKDETNRMASFTL
jgi:hypothetical protein